MTRKRLGTNRKSIKNALNKKREGEKIWGLNQIRLDEMRDHKNESINFKQR